MDSDEEDTRIYKVVINGEEQYSIWSADGPNAAAWERFWKSGTKDEFLALIKEAWTDMRPLSLRKKMNNATKQQHGTAEAASG
jgi:MbtH protein